MAKIGGFSFSSVPRPRAPLRRRRRPLRAFFYRLRVTFVAGNHIDLVAFDFSTQGYVRLAIHDPLAQSSRHFVRLGRGQTQLRADLAVGQVQPHEVRTQHPGAKRLVMARKDRACPIIKTTPASVTTVALAMHFMGVMAIFYHLMALAMGATNPLWPAQVLDHLVAFGVVNEALDRNRHEGWDTCFQ